MQYIWEDTNTPLDKMLRDMGCNQSEIDEILMFHKQGNIGGELRTLAAHRKKLLDAVHENERMISYVDYLSFLLSEKKEATHEKYCLRNRCGCHWNGVQH